MQDEKQEQEAEGADAQNDPQRQEEQKPQQSAEQQMTHVYVEVGSDLLSKPNALSDIIQAEGYPRCLIFCNSPSEADLADVILKKRSIASSKLIGHIPYTRVSQALSQLSKGEITALVVTDVSAGELDPGVFDLIVNYAIHEDPEIYLHRLTAHERNSRIKKVVSLVSPLDFGNFHYLRKVVDFEFEKGVLPSKEQIYQGEAARLIAAAKLSPVKDDPRVKQFVPQVLDNPDRDAIVAYLLYNTLVALPELEHRTRSHEHEDEGGRRERRGGERERGERYDRGDRGDRGERGERGERSDRGERRGGDRRRDQRGQGRGRYEGEGRDYDERGPRQEMTPPKRDVRLYIGQGLKSGLSDEVFRKEVERSAGITPDQIKRLSIRDNYAFVDFDEELGDTIVEKLKETEIEGVGRLFVQRATTINVPRENEEGREEHGEEGRPRHYEEDEGDEGFGDEPSDEEFGAPEEEDDEESF